MVQPPSAPAGQRVKLRGDYTRAAPDYTVEQRWDDYDALEHDTWRTLYLRQIELARRHAPPEFLAGLDLVGTRAESIPRFAEVNRTLGAATGWRIVAVPGLIPEEHFFAHLAARSFPVSVWMREPAELDYLAEPDLFHDFFGHVPLLAHPVFARFMQAYGAGGLKAQAHDAVKMLARLYWYTVEFGLVRSGAALKAYGAGILSSRGETVYSVESPVPHRVAFDLVRVLRTDYLIDDFQRIYFVLDDFEQLFHAGYDTDFAPIYRRYAHTPGIAPGELLPTDHVIARGTQQRAGSAP
jgi:phenylalanine-4-hydroxylase